MNYNDKRELEKVLEAVGLAVEYHEKTNEANAKLHLSSKVLYSPLTVKLQAAQKILIGLVE
jgi:hypothetical protein